MLMLLHSNDLVQIFQIGLLKNRSHSSNIVVLQYFIELWKSFNSVTAVECGLTDVGSLNAVELWCDSRRIY